MPELKETLLIGKVRPSFAVFVNDMLKAPITGYCAEIGVSRGYNAETMLKMINATFVLVDDYTKYVEYPDAEESAKDRLSVFGERAVMIKKNSVDAAKTFDDGKFDYVYIDGGHTYEDVLADLESWWPKVHDFGMIAGHDFCSPGVYKATREFADKVGKIVFGVAPFSNTGAINHWNMAQMCDWWIYK